ncbi:unnamed protein product [Ascophyllum nodosum]
MLSIRFVAVKDVLDTVQDLSVEEGGPQQDNHTAQWSIQVQHGEQRQRTRSIAIAEDAEENQQSQHAIEVSEEERSPLWDEEIEIEDIEGEEKVDIALLCDLTSTMRDRPQVKLRHSSTSIEMRTFRDLPDQSVSLWIPLRSAGADADQEHGSLHVSVTYSTHDCVAQGYIFGMFCGLAPTFFAPAWMTEIPFKMGSAALDRHRRRDTAPSLRTSISMPLDDAANFISPRSRNKTRSVSLPVPDSSSRK